MTPIRSSSQPGSTGSWTEIRWQPGRELGVALALLGLFWLLFYLGSVRTTGWVSTLVFLGLAHVAVGVGIPSYLLLQRGGERVDAVGLAPRRWAQGLAVSGGLAVVLAFRLVPEMTSHPLSVSVPTLLVLAFSFAEPFFVHGYLQGRFERAFGPLPAIALAGASFGLYHVGTFPLGAVGFLVVVGIGLGLLYRTTGSLLAVWPLTYASFFTIGTLELGSPFSWTAVWRFGAALVVEVAVLAWFTRRG